MLLDGFDYILEKIPYFAQSVAYAGSGGPKGDLGGDPKSISNGQRRPMVS